MRKEDKEKQLDEAAKKRAESVKPPEKPPMPPSLSDFTSRQVPRVKLVTGGQQEQDILATQAMLDAWQTPDGWKCPRCPYLTTDRHSFLEHLETEINKAMELMERRASRSK